MSTQSDKLNRRWLRLSLRTFLVLLTIGCLWLGWIVNRANEQRRAVEWVNELGGRIVYDYESDEIVYQREVPRPGPDWLRDLIGIDYFADVVTIDLKDTPISDVTPLANLANLEKLMLSDT